MSDAVEVRLLGFPLDVHARAVEHHEELLREFQLLALDESRDVPRRLAALVAEFVASYGSLGISAAAERDAARARGETTVDLTYHVPPALGEACDRLDRMFDEADAFCRQDRLLTLAADPEIAAFRHWSLGEFTAQIGGAAPTPWSGVSATPR